MTDDAATKVEWRDWGPAAFEEARRTGKPILLSLVTEWSSDCKAMDAGTYSEPRVAANINDGFVPVRVDADRRPRIRERYNMGGFPSTVFLTPAGTVLTGATFLAVDGFRGILDSVRKTWDGKGESAGSVPRALRNAEPTGGEVTPRIEEHMIEQLLAAYDEEFGGWGSDVKFPLPRTIEFALVRARDQATRTLDAVQTHLLDTYDGGFYRYATNRNWGSAVREKLTDENAALVRAFAHGYRYTGDENYRDSAAQTIEYLTTDCWTGEAFASGQGGSPGYYTLEPSDREEAETPPVDGTVLADRNGLAIDGLLTFAAYTDDERALRYADRARQHVVETLVDGGTVAHYAESEATQHADRDTAPPSGLLVDQARLLGGLTTSWQVRDKPGPARDIADWTLDTLQADSGGFRDGPTDGPGLLDRPLYPLDTTVEMADNLLTLSLLTGNDEYREAATDAVAAFGAAAERMGVEVAHFASTAARLLEPQAIEVGTPAGSDLHRAALRLADHETVVVPDADCKGQARVVTDGTVEDTADSPATLESVLTDGGV